MPTIDWMKVTAEILRGIIDLIVGGGVGYIIYRLARKREEIRWHRQLERQEVEWRRRLEEQARQQVREDLLRGLGNPQRAIESLSNLRELLMEIRSRGPQYLIPTREQVAMDEGMSTIERFIGWIDRMQQQE
jgi:hypothetical protein